MANENTWDELEALAGLIGGAEEALKTAAKLLRETGLDEVRAADYDAPACKSAELAVVIAPRIEQIAADLGRAWSGLIEVQGRAAESEAA